MAKVVFSSSSHRAISVLEALQKNFEVVAVLSQPDRPVGREGKTTQTKISVFAQKNRIPLLKPERLDNDALRWIKAKKYDVWVSAYYGLLIPPEFLSLTEGGILNIHPSLLPAWRGPSPVQAAIVAGDKETGVTIIKMDEEFDHGPIVSQFNEPIRPDDNQETLYTRLFEKAAGVLVEILPAYLEGRAQLREQDHSKASYTTLIKKEHGFIPPKFIDLASQVFDPEAQTRRGETLRTQWQITFIKDYSLVPSASSLERFIRAMDPWPNAWTQVQLSVNGQQSTVKRMKILKAHLDGGKLVLDEVQLEGKKPVTFKQLLEGYPSLAFAS